MKTYLTSRHAAVAAVGGFLTVLSFSGVALAITDTIFKYSSPKTGTYTIGSASMTPQDTTAGSNYSNSGSDGGLIVLGQQRCFLTGVNLTSGVTITAVRVWYSSGITGNPTVRLLAHVLAIGQANVIAGDTIVDDSAIRKAVNLTLPPAQKINNNANAYGLSVCLFPGDVFYAARIAYTYENAGD